MFIRINPDEEKFNIFTAINKIHRHIKKSTKKFLIHKISKRLLTLEFKSSHSIIKKALKRKYGKYTIKNKNDKNWKTIWNNALF